MAKTEALASAAQPVSNQSYQSLTMLVSKQSWRVGSSKVIVYSPWTETYTYQWEGKARETTAWRCMLVDAADATLYCMGEFKLTDKNKSIFETHVKTHVPGAQLVLTDVCPVENSQTQYRGCSVRGMRRWKGPHSGRQRYRRPGLLRLRGRRAQWREQR